MYQVHGKCSNWPKIEQKCTLGYFLQPQEGNFGYFAFFPILRQPKCAEAAILGKIPKN